MLYQDAASFGKRRTSCMMPAEPIIQHAPAIKLRITCRANTCMSCHVRSTFTIHRHPNHKEHRQGPQSWKLPRSLPTDTRSQTPISQYLPVASTILHLVATRSVQWQRQPTCIWFYHLYVPRLHFEKQCNVVPAPRRLPCDARADIHLLPTHQATRETSS